MGVLDALTRFFKSPPPPERKRGEKMKPRKWRGEPSRRLPKEVMEVVSAYEPKPKEHPLALRYQPKLKGQGGEHVVYEVAGSPDVVVKVDKVTMRQILQWQASHREGPETISADLQDHLEKRLKEKQRLVAALKKHFGAEHVLPQKMMLMKVPLTPGVIGELNAKDMGPGVHVPFGLREITTIVTVQRTVRELGDETHLCLTTGRAEEVLLRDAQKKPDARYVYRKMTDPLMSAETAAKTRVPADSLAELINNPQLSKLVAAAKHDTGLRDVIKDFCEKAASFAEATGEVIDLIGRDNVIFFKKPDGAWTYLLVDAFYGFQSLTLEKGHEAYLKAQVGAEIDDAEYNAFANGVNFTRIINGLGKTVGAAKFYDFLPAEDGEPPDVLGTFLPSLKRAPSRAAGEAA